MKLQRQSCARRPCARRRSRGFSLLEMVVVVVILAILASLATLAVSRAHAASKMAAVQEAVLNTSNAIDTYRAQAGVLPNLIGPDWTPLTTQVTLADGTVIGPLLSKPPVNPLIAGSPSTVTDGNAATLSVTVAAFQYDYNGGNGSGRFIAATDP